mmetsp:Transcript_127862/g.355821  ORF Transcript_127862/g.355821 Transcript_127862/m.355821 type:complete len:324 (-) Transcript_127862:172-1143(-)
MWQAPSLSGKVALVAGATRGCGRAIAVTLGECGATVICTGRSVRGALASGESRPETIDETAELASKAGGVGIAIRCDHTVADEVAKLAEQLKRDHGGVDILINDLWGSDGNIEWGKKMWECDLAKGLQVLKTAVHGHIMTSHALLPLLVAKRGGIAIEVTDGDHMGYRGNFFYDLAKSDCIRMAFALHKELASCGCRAFCVTPGFIRSEMMLELFKCTEDNYKTEAPDADFRESSETPFLLARGVAHLVAAPPKEFGVFGSWTLSETYGFSDKDGSRPHWGQHFEKKYGRHKALLDQDMLARWDSGPMEAVEQANANQAAPSC